MHVNARTQFEKDFFGNFIKSTVDYSNPIYLKKGEINNHSVVENILKLNPDLLVCYGSSLIKSKLIELFNKKFLNVHLGLSPYYEWNQYLATY